tara:strand:+ start:324 stop:617 length:294 start_codon:yes stop_codon:yes gene_type:complete
MRKKAWFWGIMVGLGLWAGLIVGSLIYCVSGAGGGSWICLFYSVVDQNFALVFGLASFLILFLAVGAAIAEILTHVGSKPPEQPVAMMTIGSRRRSD